MPHWTLLKISIQPLPSNADPKLIFPPYPSFPFLLIFLQFLQLFHQYTSFVEPVSTRKSASNALSAFNRAHLDLFLEAVETNQYCAPCNISKHCVKSLLKWNMSSNPFRQNICRRGEGQGKCKFEAIKDISICKFF